MVILWQDYCGKRQFEKILLKYGWEKVSYWEQTQVMSPSSASTSVASTRRSIFLPERAASSWRVTRQSPLQRTLTFLDVLHKFLERKAELDARGEKLAQQRLFEADADVEVKHWEKRNSDIAIYEINQEFESQRSQPQQANQWADQAQREKISLCREVEKKNRLFRENRAKNCQQIEKLRRICCEETNRARQARIDELSMHQERNPTTVSQLLTQIQDLQNKVNFLSDAIDFFRS